MIIKGRMLVTVDGQYVGLVQSWTKHEVFVHYWDQEKGCFERDAAATARKDVKLGGKIEWAPPKPKPKPKETASGGTAKDSE